MNALPTIAESVSFQQWAILLVLGVAAVIIWWSWGGNRRGLGATPKQYRREIDSANAQGETVKRDMEQLLTELEDLSAKINTQVDGTYGKLQQLVTEADKRIQVMRILIAECKRLAVEPDAAAAATEGEPAQPAEAPPAYQAQAEPTTTGPAAPAAPTGPVAESVSDRPAPTRHEQVCQLADKGLTAVQIARELQMQPGEVELILGLRRVAQS